MGYAIEHATKLEGYGGQKYELLQTNNPFKITAHNHATKTLMKLTNSALSVVLLGFLF